MNWQDSNGITAWQKANTHLSTAHWAADRVSVFTHTDWPYPIPPSPRSIVHYQFTTGSVSPIPRYNPVGNTDYNVAMQRALYLAYIHPGYRTCIIFISDGTESYNPSTLAAFQWYLKIWSFWFRCPICIKCLLTHTAISDPFGNGTYNFRRMCKTLNAEIEIQRAE